MAPISRSSDGRILAISSTDGYCSLTSFEERELGDVYAPEDKTTPVRHSSNDTIKSQAATPDTCKKEGVSGSPVLTAPSSVPVSGDTAADIEPIVNKDKARDTMQGAAPRAPNVVAGDGILSKGDEPMETSEPTQSGLSVKSEENKESTEDCLKSCTIIPSAPKSNKPNILIPRRAPKSSITFKSLKVSLNKTEAESKIDTEIISCKSGVWNNKFNEASTSKTREEDIEEEENGADISDGSVSIGSNDSEEEEVDDDNLSVMSFDDEDVNKADDAAALEEDDDMGVTRIPDEDDDLSYAELCITSATDGGDSFHQDLPAINAFTLGKSTKKALRKALKKLVTDAESTKDSTSNKVVPNVITPKVNLIQVKRKPSVSVDYCCYV